ncbi:hypothetical protein Tco_1343532 [Tanacetum coccineum]
MRKRRCTYEFSNRGSGAKRMLTRCGRNQNGNKPILALSEEARQFHSILYARSKDMERMLGIRRGGLLLPSEKGKCSVVPRNREEGVKQTEFRDDVRCRSSCGSKYLAYSEVEVEYQGSSGLLLQPELPE